MQSSTDKRTPAERNTPQRQGKKGGMKPDEAHYPTYCPQMSVSQGTMMETVDYERLNWFTSSLEGTEGSFVHVRVGLLR